jgi:hypothetical protein
MKVLMPDSPGLPSDDGITDGDEPSIDVWDDEDKVSFVIVNPSIIEYEDRLTPGLALSPIQAVRIAAAILEKALKAAEFKEE